MAFLPFGFLNRSPVTTLGSPGRELLLVLHFFTGLGLGGEWALGMTLIAERISTVSRGRVVALGNIGWLLGILLAAVFAYCLDPLLGWRITFVLAAFPALLHPL